MNTYSFHINAYDPVFIGAIFIVLNFSLLLWFNKKINLAANRFLVLALAAVVLWLAKVVAIDTGLYSYDWYWLPFSLAAGPLIYFYVLKTTTPHFQFRFKHLLHFSPLLMPLCAPVIGVERLGSVLQTLSLISVGIYLYLSQMLIKGFYGRQEFTGGDRYRLGLRWLQRQINVFCMVWLLWLLFTVVAFIFFHTEHGIYTYHPLYLLLSITAIWTAVASYLRPGVSVIEDMPAALKALPQTELKQRGAWLKKVVKTNLYYQDPDLTLTSLAEKLDLTTHELSRIINQGLKKSFSDFINEYRVAGVIRKMNDPAYDRITLIGMAYDSGFNSKSTFNRIFKEVTGLSPAEYKANKDKELPSYNLRPESATTAIISQHQTALKWPGLKLNRNYMIRNYFKIAWRNLTRNRSYAAINITGLAVGIAVCMVIFVIIQYQTSFDDFHARKDRAYRVLTEYHHAETGDVSYGKDIPFPLPVGLKTAFPQIEEVAPIFASQNDQLFVLNNNGNTEKVFKEQRGVFYMSPSFFKIFDFPLLAGSYASLNDPDNVFLTKETAEKYFGDWKVAMGKTIKLQMGGYMFEHGTDVLKVSGILATIPSNTDFQLKVVVSFGTGFTGDYLSKSREWDATVADFGCYILLPKNTNTDNFNQQLKAYSQKVQSPANRDTYLIQPLNAVHFDTQAGDYSNKTISHQLLNVLWLIAAFILLIACVNFINLSTAQAVNRAKEVGVRKVLGSNVSQLRAQFLAETFLIVICAVILAATTTFFALPYINQLLELSLSFNLLSDPLIILFLLAVTLIVTALAGFYPSIVLSRFNPVNALRSKLTSTNVKGISLRRGLVVFQFIIAQTLIIGTLIIVEQMNYFMDQPLGFDKDAVINVPFRVDSLRMSRLDYLKNQLLTISGVQAVSISSNTPIENGSDTWTTLKYNHAIKETDFKAITKFADEGYVPAYKLKLIAGHNLQPSSLTKEFLVNEALVKSLGLKKPEDILNKEISIWNGQITCPVVGVLKDFNDRSFRQQLAPVVITQDIAMYNQAGIKLSTKNISSTLQAVKQVFDKTFPDFVYEYKFLDEKIAGFYKQETQLAALYKIFAAIAIFLSCLGLYGLASFMAVQRVKEVGIRKVLGATASSILYLFSKEFIILIAVAFAIAAPIAWYYMHQWVQAYAYRISISWWLIAAGGLAAIFIALATISFQAMKAAMANPVKSLRSE
ncbi:ABC transporter permease [Mucilaginibacter sp. L3T2-6]|uniref:ABC transporter permease n=1 Tax=Mucilaginibacter sp. L3T2-6 TaxID=3062491 RepID=UPI0026749087|nr:ABC transporter permease [Mucilaginibacter sp. L3T2-6]MDO3644205.1 ABC transporter permease [Mucilaginibacter sp. L3T2-6]MDV6216698.1 ABC transporter permease [Mucilaginibacter sp. L3T2-6]